MAKRSATSRSIATDESRRSKINYRRPPGFWSLMFTRFQGAFSDNALKWLVIFLVFGMGLPAD